MAFYRDGVQIRPGQYISLKNRENVVSKAAFLPEEPTPAPPAEDTDGITVAYDASGIVTLIIPGGTVTHDGNGTVTLAGIARVAYDNEGNVTIGG